MIDREKVPFLTRIVEVFLRGDVAILLTMLALVLGGAALYLTPREEEPQIVVPLADVLISAPGLSAEEVEQQVTTRLEKLLYQIDGVEYVYSMSQPGQAVVTVRFYVSEDREDSLVKLYNKLESNRDLIPPTVTSWFVKPLEIDDVPIVNVTLWSSRPQEYGDHQLRRVAEQVQNELQALPNTNRVRVISGRPRRIRVELDPIRLAGRRTAALQVAQAIQAGNVNARAGQFDQQNREFLVDAGRFVPDAEALGKLVVNISGGRPVYLKDVATITDGPAEIENYSWIGFGPADQSNGHSSNGTTQKHEVYPAVHIAIAKRKGTNAVRVADAVHQRMRELTTSHLPDGMHYRITRDYGETADDKVNELVEGLAIAVLTVIGLIGITLGWRAAVVIALAVPVCYSITLFINLGAGYSINRVTMFALILSLGLLVDDPITDVENIARHFSIGRLPPREATLLAIQEVRPSLLLSTLAIICSFLPLAFITGMMGPYMRPMAVNVPLTVTVSTVVAFLITPWLAMVMLKHAGGTSAPTDAEHDASASSLYRFFNWMLRPVLLRPWLSWAVLAGVVVLLLVAIVIPLFRVVPLKMLPYDNKNEFQLVIDLPEGTTLDRTNTVALELGRYLSGVNEVRDFEIYVGTASPMDFNGLVRHYFLRERSHQAEIRINLADKDHRVQQSHEIVLRIRRDVERIARAQNANVKFVEVPPGPPVIATVTAEVYGPPDASYRDIVALARQVEARMAREPGIVDVDSSAEAEQTKWVFVADKPKAALSGVSTKNMVDTLQLALGGSKVSVLHQPREVDPLWIELRLPRVQRSAIDDLEEIYVVGQQGQLVQLGALGAFIESHEDQTIYHNNLKRVAYVYGEVAGRPPADAILDMEEDRGLLVKQVIPRPVTERTWLQRGGGDPWTVPENFEVKWSGEGEWKITLDVFRDLGIAFAAALFGIFVILMFQTGSRVMPLIIMLAIPLTLIGIMPGFWILNALINAEIGGYDNPVFFTATAMIGMIALAGIVVRNSVVLIDFIQSAMADGTGMNDAIIQSLAVRTRPILLTAGTTLLGNWIITLDPIFSGLAWAIIFGILTSTLFTLIVIPVVYALLFSRKVIRKTDRL